MVLASNTTPGLSHMETACVDFTAVEGAHVSPTTGGSQPSSVIPVVYECGETLLELVTLLLADTNWERRRRQWRVKTHRAWASSCLLGSSILSCRQMCRRTNRPIYRYRRTNSFLSQTSGPAILLHWFRRYVSRVDSRCPSLKLHTVILPSDFCFDHPTSTIRSRFANEAP